ncbi:hypothetical protein JTE90_021281 [Oedothorax gibbosus]|uniref:Uncharacterized protein n=1 Tax=Oedothorax gibbosus TaxID=931172 RepID=A0AAV6U678_9ARAC|nr:hypothetical protein JTE90_021281 [Oedothorax gibbosus]
MGFEGPSAKRLHCPICLGGREKKTRGQDLKDEKCRTCCSLGPIFCIIQCEVMNYPRTPLASLRAILVTVSWC